MTRGSLAATVFAGAVSVQGVAIALLVSALALGWFQIGFNGPNHDNAYLIKVSQGILQGKRYYDDFFELNPPLYPILLIPANLLARLLGVPPYGMFAAYVAALIWLSSMLCHRSLVRAFDLTPLGHACLAVTLQATMFLIAEEDYGQRDHLAIILMLPAVMWMATRTERDGAAPFDIAVAALGTIGCLIKPFLALVPLATYAVRIAERRDWRVLVEPAVTIFLAGIILYGAVILQEFPEWIRMALIAGTYYGEYDTDTLINTRVGVAILVVVAAAVFNELVAQNPAERRFSRYIAAAALGAAGSYIVQHKGWNYHFVPLRLLCGVLLAISGLIAFRPAARWWNGRLYAQRALLVCLAAGLVLLRSADWTTFKARRQDRFMRQLAGTLAELGIGRRIFVMSTSEYPAYPLDIYYDTQPATRFSHLWTIPHVVALESGPDESPQRLAATREMSITLVAEDFRRYSPDGIVVDESPTQQALRTPLDFIAWFRRDPEMAAILTQYDLVGHVSDRRAGARYNNRYAIYKKR